MYEHTADAESEQRHVTHPAVCQAASPKWLHADGRQAAAQLQRAQARQSQYCVLINAIDCWLLHLEPHKHAPTAPLSSRAADA